MTFCSACGVARTDNNHRTLLNYTRADREYGNFTAKLAVPDKPGSKKGKYDAKVANFVAGVHEARPSSVLPFEKYIAEHKGKLSIPHASGNLTSIQLASILEMLGLVGAPSNPTWVPHLGAQQGSTWLYRLLQVSNGEKDAVDASMRKKATAFFSDLVRDLRAHGFDINGLDCENLGW